MIMKSSQFQWLMQVIDIRLIPLASNIFKRNLARIIDSGNQPHIFCVEPISHTSNAKMSQRYEFTTN
jgi:hypothetical protein